MAIDSSYRSIPLREGDISVPEALVRSRIIPCGPHSPGVGVAIRVLELYRNNSLRCPQLAIQPCKQFSVCFDVYLSIRQTVHEHIHAAIGRDSLNWRRRHACPACTHRLQGEPKLKFDMLVTMDGNDSLKRILRRGAAPVTGEDGDEPVVGQSVERSDNREVSGDYYLPQETVDCWSKEVLAARAGAQAVTTDVSAEGQDDSGCDDQWKNMADHLTARMWGIFYETGIFLSLC